MSRPSPARCRYNLAAIVATGSVLLIWQVLSDFGLTNPAFLPSPQEIAVTLFNELNNGSLISHIQASCLRLFPGIVLGTLLGLWTGLAIHLSFLTRAVLAPWITCLFAVPKIALLPLFILWLGTGGNLPNRHDCNRDSPAFCNLHMALS